MFRKFVPWERKIPEEEIIRMEDYLNTMMTTVEPRREFVRDLHQGLNQKEIGVSRSEEGSFFQNLFWIGAGFASAVFLITVGIKVIINLVRNMGRMRKGRQKGITPYL